jgi:hypothetical protein
MPRHWLVLPPAQATYYVWPLWQHIVQNILVHMARTCMYTLPLMGVLYVGIDVILDGRLPGGHRADKR